MSGRMKKKIAGLSAAIGSVVAALVGSSAFGENPWITNIVVGGLAITMILNLFTSEDISRDLRHGTFEELIRNAVKRKIGRAHVLIPVTNAHLVCSILLEKKKN